MKLKLRTSVWLAILAMVSAWEQSALGTEAPPSLATFSVPDAGSMQIIFHGQTGPFVVQSRSSMAPAAPWTDVPTAVITELEAGVFMALIPKPDRPVDLGFYRIVSEGDPNSELKGWTILLGVSAPPNGTHFVPGESPVVTVTILDNFAQGMSVASFSSLNLYAYGPEDPMKSFTPVKLLNATADRTKTPHHYINLKSNTDVKMSGTTLTYSLKPVSDEPAGTYSLGVRAVLASDEVQQIIKYAKIQIGTPTVEVPLMTKTKCAPCHEGPDSGKMYMHHVDPSRSPVGSWSYDYEPITSCKICHNNEGYAAYTVVQNGVTNRIPDPIVFRAHGVHNGNRLKLPANTNQVNGIFADYVHVAFPADIHNCTYCHSDDRWKTQPSRMACGSCHDNTWFGAEPVPAGYAEHDGGQQDDDASCSVCHPANPGGRFEAISEIHKIEDPAYKQTIELTLSTPANSKFFVAGESPMVNIKVIDVATGKVVDPATIKEPLVSTNVQPGEWRRGNLMVAGPRANTVPVLTTAATNVPFTTSYANNDFRVRVKPANEDPRVTRTAEAVVYQLMDVASLAPGTYTVYAEVQANVSGVPGGMSWMNFQVGTATTEKMPAGNCTACHANMRMHETSRAVEFHPDVCKVCHDNLHQLTGKTNWNNSQWGFGTGPLSRKTHGVHFGNYTENPQDLNSGAFAHVIFPMDVRNCTKCHSETPSWTENAGRLPCSACHDSSLAVTHMALQTYDPTPVDPWNGDEIETCEICHGGEADYAPKNVHRISNPFVPIYPRAPRE